MLNINGILKAILSDLKNKPELIKVVDDQHLVDTISGVEFHLYDDYFQMTRGDEKAVSVSSFSDAEKVTVMEIKNHITDPEVTADKKENYKEHIAENRQRFSDWFEVPIPVSEGIVEEEDTEEYVR